MHFPSSVSFGFFYSIQIASITGKPSHCTIEYGVAVAVSKIISVVV